MVILGVTKSELLFSGVLIALTLLGTYVGSFGEAIARLLHRMR